MRKPYRHEKTETNSYAWSRTHKSLLSATGEINCDYCAYHRNENHSRDCRRSWKYFRHTQYKPKEV